MRWGQIRLSRNSKGLEASLPEFCSKRPSFELGLLGEAVSWILIAAGALALLFSATTTSDAHQFSLSSSRYADGDVFVVATVGHGLRGEPIAFDLMRCAELKLNAPESRDLLPGALHGKPYFASISVKDGALLSYVSKFTENELSPEMFEGYLAEEGLDAALRAWRVLPPDQRSGRERFRRTAKLWIRGSAVDHAALTSVGLPLEIVPLDDPAEKSSLRFQVLRDGRPLSGMLVRAWWGPLQDGRVFLDQRGLDSEEVRDEGRTDENGLVELDLDRRGEWLLGTIHLEAAAETEWADWESTWASLNFSR